jgi:hypothetical protein
MVSHHVSDTETVYAASDHGEWSDGCFCRRSRYYVSSKYCKTPTRFGWFAVDKDVMRLGRNLIDLMIRVASPSMVLGV